MLIWVLHCVSDSSDGFMLFSLQGWSSGAPRLLSVTPVSQGLSVCLSVWTPPQGEQCCWSGQTLNCTQHTTNTFDLLIHLKSASELLSHRLGRLTSHPSWTSQRGRTYLWPSVTCFPWQVHRLRGTSVSSSEQIKAPLPFSLSTESHVYMMALRVSQRYANMIPFTKFQTGMIFWYRSFMWINSLHIGRIITYLPLS